MNGKLIATVVVLALVQIAASSSSWAEELSYEERKERFEFFTACGPMNLVVEGLDKDAQSLGLSESRLTAAIESRLRSARLFSSDADRYLYLNVNVVGRAFSVTLKFNKRMRDLDSREISLSPSWDAGTTGTHGSGSQFVIDAAIAMFDRFLVDYLRVNEAECGPSPVVDVASDPAVQQLADNQIDTAIRLRHPDYDKTLETPEFMEWLNADATRRAVAETTRNPAVMIGLFDQFEESRAANPPKKAPSKGSDNGVSD